MAAKAGRRQFSDALIDDAVEYFSSAFRDAACDVCPDPELLRSAAASPELVAGEIRAHLFRCSRCFSEFRRHRRALFNSREVVRSRAGLRFAWPAAACLVLAASAWLFWHGAADDIRQPVGGSGSVAASGAATREAIPTSQSVVSIRLSALPITRGAEDRRNTSDPAVLVAASLVRLVIELPRGYAPGQYEIAVVTAFDEVLVRTEVRAKSRHLEWMLDASRLTAGPRFVRVGPRGHPPDYVPITIVRP